ncbi:acyl-coenzyme A thioesterase 13-like [Pectinophora gossypiella]|uniref:acyl-coenzyme A thioesterase 13-like n=1 Tax=Pectinophora gossypiella TaxID=13191 RepID=UPI00214F2530|nr:acyl-coenzyme A thioesterase 13-like [Pectinophora gossypiella]
MSSTRGLRVLKAIEHYVKTKPDRFDTMNIFNKMELSSPSNGHLRGSFTVDSSMCNCVNAMHGGYITALVDTFAAYAYVCDEKGKLAWTTSMHVNFLKSALKGEKVTIEAYPLKSGNQPVMEAIIRNEAGNVLVKGTVSMQAGQGTIQEMAKAVFQFDFDEKSKL